MTEELPVEPARPEGSATVLPEPDSTASEQRLEQPIPGAVTPARSAPPMMWAIVAGLFLLGIITVIIGGAFWYVQNYQKDAAKTKPAEDGETDSPLADSRRSAGGKTPKGNGAVGSRQRTAGVDDEQRRQQEEQRREREARRREESARRREKIIAFRLLAKKTQKDLDALLHEVTIWKTKIATLLDSVPGRRIAGSAPHLEQFTAVYEMKPLEKADVEALQQRLDALQQPLKDAGKDSSSTYTPSRALTNDLLALRKEIQAAVRKFRPNRLAIEAIMDATAKLAASETTLRAAIVAFHKAEGSRRAAAAAKAREKAQQEVAQKLAEAEAAKVKAEGRVKLLKIQAKQAKAEDAEKALSAKILAEAKEREAARKKAALTRQFERAYPAMRKFLTPFTSVGYTQPVSRGFQRTTVKGPVSFSKLQGAGWLTKDINSLKTLYYATTANRMNDRPAGGFPVYVGGAQDWAARQESIQVIQDFLNKYGVIMVDKKLLAP